MSNLGSSLALHPIGTHWKVNVVIFLLQEEEMKECFQVPVSGISLKVLFCSVCFVLFVVVLFVWGVGVVCGGVCVCVCLFLFCTIIFC